MTDERTFYFSIPVINKHRKLSQCALGFSVVEDESELKNQLLRAPPELRKLRLDALQPPKLYIALGKEASFAPPSLESEGRLEFMTRVLAVAKEDDRCGLKDACQEEIIHRAEDVDAAQFYVFPSGYRPVTHIGHIPAELARALVRRNPCGEGGEADDPFQDWKEPYRLQLAYREVQQVLIKAVACTPFVLEISQYAIGGERREVKTGSISIPALFV